MGYPMKKKILAVMASLALSGAANAQWDSVVGDVGILEEIDHHWVTANRGNTVYMVNTATGEVGASLAVSNFTPAIAPHMEEGRIYTYGSYYSRGLYGDRTDLFMVYDAQTASPIAELELPQMPAGIGHPGMMGLINNKFVGLWNISPATSVSIIDVENMSFVGEVSMPSCSGIYPEGQGWISICGDGTALYIELNNTGQVSRRVQSRAFFDVFDDFVWDYSVPAADGWMFMSVDGFLRKVTLNGDTLNVSEPFDINPDTNGMVDVNGVAFPNDDHWRIVGSQPFAWHDSEALLATVMRDGGGREYFDKYGTEIWVFNMRTGNRGVRIKLDDGVDARGVLLTPGPDPMLVINTSAGMEIREPRTGVLKHTLPNASGTIQALYEGMR
jgi:methylamine dehydrogenase heavy chain